MSSARRCSASTPRRSCATCSDSARPTSRPRASKARFSPEEGAMTHRVLILGASYGSLFGTKLLMARQSVALVCTRPTAELINRDGTVVKFTIKGQLVDVPSSKLPGTLSASAPDDIDPAAFELIVLGMQEAQYGSPGERELMRRVAEARV